MNQLAEEEKRLMEQYGIQAEQKTVYRYKGHTYEHLEHAIGYAKIDAARSHGEFDMTKVFKSKRDTWIVALIWAGALISVFGALTQFTSAASLLTRAAMLVFLGSAAAFMLWVLYGTDYTLTNENLLIRCGPFRYRVALPTIDSVSPSRSPLSSPACSLDRLLIKWNDGRKRILVSPSGKTDFLRALDSLCPQLRLDGDSLVRGSAR